MILLLFSLAAAEDPAATEAVPATETTVVPAPEPAPTPAPASAPAPVLVVVPPPAPVGPLFIEQRPGFDWVVVDKRTGRTLSTQTLSSMMADREMEEMLKHAHLRTVATQISLATTGSVLFIGALVEQSRQGPGYPRQQDFVVNCGDYANSDACSAEQFRLDGLYQRAKESADAHRSWSTLALLGGSAICFITIPFGGNELREQKLWPSLAYDQGVLQQRLDAYNLAQLSPPPAETPAETPTTETPPVETPPAETPPAETPAPPVEGAQPGTPL